MSFRTGRLAARSARISGRCMYPATGLHPEPASYLIQRLRRPVTGGSVEGAGVCRSTREKECLKIRAILCQEKCG